VYEYSFKKLIEIARDDL